LILEDSHLGCLGQTGFPACHINGFGARRGEYRYNAQLY
jgi:hypothetical protein